MPEAPTGNPATDPQRPISIEDRQVGRGDMSTTRHWRKYGRLYQPERGLRKGRSADAFVDVLRDP